MLAANVWFAVEGIFMIHYVCACLLPNNVLFKKMFLEMGYGCLEQEFNVCFTMKGMLIKHYFCAFVGA